MAMVWTAVDITKFESLGKLLQAKRDALDGTPDKIEQADVALAIGFSQPYVSKIERGLADDRIPLWPSRKQTALIKIYRFTAAEAEQIAEKFNLDLFPDVPPESSPATADGPKAMHYGSISAGITGRTKPIKPYPTNIPGWLARKYDPSDIFVLTVEGDSMTCDDIRKSIPEGTEVYFHKSLQPDDGEIVAVWLEDHDFGVIKIYRPQRDTTVLQSYNFKHPPILIDERNPAIVQGVYVGKSEPSRLRFDR